MKNKYLLLIISLLLVALFVGSVNAQDKKYVFGYSVQDLGNQYWQTVAQGIKDRAAELGNVDIVVLDARTDPEKQLAHVEDLVQKKVDAILLSPWDPDTGGSAVEVANKAGIPVFVLDVGVNSGKIETFIVSDNFKGGELAGEFIAEKLGGKGKVVVIECQLGYVIPALREEGFVKTMEKYGIEVVAKQPADSQRALGLTVMENFIQAYPDINAVFACNDEMALGALEAVRSAGLQDKIIVVGFDAIADAVKSVEEGGLAGTVAQKPYEIGKMGVDAALKFLNGEKLEETTYVPVELITKESLEKK
ncbi:MAG: D-ribose ABC transporter substrate-binding protein [Candidatus Atribacteria bacterium]|nr:D-ribose ABC transporter substrate-binding protein [Candidatus Atribacteria bacterium]